MSSASRRVSLSTVSTVFETALRRGSGAVRMGRTAMTFEIGEGPRPVKAAHIGSTGRMKWNFS